jgi:1-deoxy-D-xylulose-5-phosphate reductoisomerase
MVSYISPLNKAAAMEDSGRALTVLGSTGSIGRNVLDVAARSDREFRIVGLAGGENTALLAQQADRWRPRVLGVKAQRHARELEDILPRGYRPDIAVGESGYVSMAEDTEPDLVVSAQVGAAGLAPTLAAVRSGHVVPLANKESLVLAGPLLREACSGSGACILPVDSEHNALFQAMAGHEGKEVAELVLTASGGPFFGRDEGFLDRVTPRQALDHPNWSMGAKISIDSATLMNKGLEIIEAHYLFGLPQERIRVLVHAESIVHSMIEYCDGSFLAHLGIPDMRIPIAYCLSYPGRLRLELPRLDLVRLGSLSFAEPDTELFPCLDLARQALRSGPSHPVVLNAANEKAVEMFLEERIGFRDIARINGWALERHRPIPISSLEDIQGLDRETRHRVDSELPRSLFAQR